jgi:molecular chaperone DnaK
MMRSLFIGIDLGTTNCKIAFVNRRADPSNETVENLRIPQFLSNREEWSAQGVPYLPSVVYFHSPTEAFVGQYAKRYMVVSRPERTLRSIKRLMGRIWAFAPFEGMNWSPQGISAIILRKLRQAAEERLQQPIEAAVITVPASFDSRQREATLDAADLAGFDRSQITLIDEPTAAILDYVAKQIRRQVSYIGLERPHVILVFDMGGGTLDVSIVQTEPQEDGLSLRILARSRYTELAGNDFDMRLAAYLLNVFEETNGLQVADLPTRRARETMSTLVNLAEDLKIAISKRLRESMVYWEDLSRLERGEVRIEQAAREIQYGETILGQVPELTLGYNAHFERIWAPFFNPDPEQVSTIYAPIKSALSEAFPDASDPRQCVDLVLLHGGMCELPIIGARMHAYFPGVRVDETPDLMNSVARGAAIYDVFLDGSRAGTFGDIRMREQPVFEAVFLERYRHGLQELVPKTAAPGDEGEMPLKVPAGRPSRLPVSLYHGFRPNDPFVTLDRELAIAFDLPPKEEETVYLGWRVLEDRTIEYWWRLEGGSPHPLRPLASQGRDIAHDAQNLSSQRALIDRLTIR